MSSPEQIETSSKKVRGMAKASLNLIERMYSIIEAVQPITGRGVGYKLFVLHLIASMKKNEMQRVYRLLTIRSFRKWKAPDPNEWMSPLWRYPNRRKGVAPS